MDLSYAQVPFRYIFSLIFHLCIVESANILLSPVFGDGSHYYSMVPIGKSLADRGNNVTFLVADVYGDRVRDLAMDNRFAFEHFTSPGLKETMDEIFQGFVTVAFNASNIEGIKFFNQFQAISVKMCESVLSDHGLLDRLLGYDAFVIDLVWTCGIYIESYLTRHKGANDISVMVFAPMTPIPHIFKEAGSPFIPSYQPPPLSRLSSPMSFFQRIKSTLIYISFTFLDKVIISGAFKNLVDKYDLDPLLGSTFSDHVDLFLISVDFSVEFPFALMPNVIPVGGITTKPAKPLEQDLELFMQGSGNEGVIVFSLGTYFSVIISMRPDIIKMFVDALSRLPQKTIMHLKQRPNFDIPGTIKVMPWLPLNDLLGHPKTRLLLTQGGNNAFYEAIYHGVPMVAMPLGADQPDVATRIVSKGLGLDIDGNRLSTDYIYQQVNKVLNDPKYLANAKRLSSIYRDRPMTAADKAASWIEHVIKHGSGHLRPPTLDLSFFQIYLFDVAVFIISVVALSCYILYRCFRLCCIRKRLPKKKKE